MSFTEKARDQISTNLTSLVDRLSPTAQLKVFGLMQVPLIFLVNPKVEKISDNECLVRVPLNYLTRNHLGSMYFGTLAIGADAAVGLFALHLAKKYKDVTVSLVFKDFKADFVKRAETDVLFKCTQGELVRQMIEEARSSGERVTRGVDVVALSADDSSEIFGRFTLGLSLKAKKKT